MMKKATVFVTEVEAELLAKKHLEAFVAECRCQNKQDILRAIEKMVGVGMHAHDVVENGYCVTVQ